MEPWLEILKYTLPSIVVFLTSLFLIRLFLTNEDRRRRHDQRMHQKDHVLPLRIQAYERLTLLLERLSPEALVMRLGQTNLNTAQMQNELIKIVRTEFEHNLAQQNYVSNKVWEMVKHARNHSIKIINTSAADLKPENPGINLSKKIMEKMLESDTNPIQDAILYIKAEVKELF